MKWFQRRIDFNALMQQHAQQLGRTLDADQRTLVARLDRLRVVWLSLSNGR